MSFLPSFHNITILVTGHTGFKGSWLCLWLELLGAKVIGFSSSVPTTPSNFILSHIKEHISHVEGDVRDLEALKEVLRVYKPTIIFHLAAQPIVAHSYIDPLKTFTTNAMGTVTLLDAVRQVNTSAKGCVKAVVCITTDKVYENKEWIWGYRENDALGGSDPYSASKAMAELAIASYRKSFFPVEKYHEHGVAIASTRAGNVIGGGDFADFRIIPDCIKSLMKNQAISVRNPLSVRPFQHVLEPLSGYLILAHKLVTEAKLFSESYNFGPRETKGVSVKEIVETTIGYWGSGSYVIDNPNQFKETNVLRLNWDKAAHTLNWSAKLSWQDSLRLTVDWYKEYYKQEQKGVVHMYEFSKSQIEKYTHQMNVY